MSDGDSDAYWAAKNFFNEYFDAYIDLLCYTDNNNLDNFKALKKRLESLAQESSRLSDRAFANYLDLPEKFISELLAQLRVGEIVPFREEKIFIPFASVLFLMFLLRSYTKIVCFLEKIKSLPGTLLIFTDKNHHIADNGVFYKSDKFLNGDQDIILGLAKKRLGWSLKKNSRLMVFAKWNEESKSWELGGVFQFCGIEGE